MAAMKKKLVEKRVCEKLFDDKDKIFIPAKHDNHHRITFLLLLHFPAMSLGFTILGEIFAYVAIFNPTIGVVTVRLCEWCMLDVFLLQHSPV